MITFWAILLAACLLWYASVTFYVAVKGAKDIRTMLDHLKGGASEQDPND